MLVSPERANAELSCRFASWKNVLLSAQQGDESRSRSWRMGVEMGMVRWCREAQTLPFYLTTTDRDGRRRDGRGRPALRSRGARVQLETDQLRQQNRKKD